MFIMAQSKTVYRIGQLKDQRVDISERLKLANKLWQTEDDVGPNKHQVIIDAIVAVLINNKKRHELSEETEKQVWQTLSILLHSQFFTSAAAGHQSAVTLRPTTAQMFVETLERGKQTTRRKGEEATSTMTMTTITSVVLDCCRCILDSPTLTPAFTSRLDILVSLCSVLCHLAVSQQCVADTCLPAVLSQVTANLWHHHHRSQLPPSQVLQLVTDKLLEGVMTLTHHAHRSQHPEPQLTATAASLQEFVLATLFHESHHKLFKSYLDAVTKPGEDTQLPWAISNLFSKISGPLQCNMEVDVTDKPEAETVSRDEVLHFLSAFFRYGVTAWKQKSQVSFQLLVHLTSYLGLPVHNNNNKEEEEGSQHTPKVVAMEMRDGAGVGVVRQLLCVVRESGAYNVAVDRAEGGEQLRFFRRLLDAVLVSAPLCGEQCRCFEELLGLNHLILEPCLPALLSHCTAPLPQMTEECRSSVDDLLSQIASTYSQLHQMPRFYDLLLQLASQSPRQLTDTLPLPRFRQQLCSAINTLAHNTAMQLWGRLQEEIISLVQQRLGESDADSDSEKLWATCLLFHQFVSQLRVLDWCKITVVGVKVGALTLKLESDLVRPLLQSARTEGNKNTLLHAAGLLLAVCLGDVKLTLADYRSSHITLPLPSPSDLPFSSSSAAVQTPKKRSKKRKTDTNPVVRFLGEVLTTQKLRLLQMGEEQEEWREQLRNMMVWDDDDDNDNDDSHHHCHWDGQVCSVNKDTYCVAKSHLLVCLNQSLLPALVSRHADRLARSVVHVLSQPSTIPPAAGHTCKSVARRLLDETTLMHLGQGPRTEFQHHIMSCVWQRFTADDDRPSSLLSSSSSSSSSSSPLLSALKKMADVRLPWHDVSDGEIKSVMESVEELLVSDKKQTFTLSDSQLTLLQVLGELPLALFPPGSRVLCTVALLLVLSHLEGRGGSGWEEEPKGGAVAVACGLLIRLLEASAGTSLFRCLNPCVLLSSLRALAVKNAVSENSSVGLVVRKAVAMVMGDFDSLLHLEAFISELEKGLKKMSRLMTTKKTIDLNQHSHRTLLMFTHYVLVECSKYMKRETSRKDVHSASQQHFEGLSRAVEDVIDADIQHHPQTSLLHPALLRCFTAVAAQRCSNSTQGSKSPLAEEDLQRIQFVVTTLSGGDCDGKVKQWRTEDLDFVSTLYHHHHHHHHHRRTISSSLLTPPLARSLWTSLLAGLLGNRGTAEERETSGVDDLKAKIADRKRRLENNRDPVCGKLRKLEGGKVQSVPSQGAKTPGSGGVEDREEDGGGERGREGGGGGEGKGKGKKLAGRKIQVFPSPEMKSSEIRGIEDGGGERGREGGGGESVRKEEEEKEEEKIVETMIVVLLSCPAPLFTELLQQVVSHMASDVRHCTLVWRKVVTSSRLSLEQRTLLQSFCITVVEQCVQVMQSVHSSRHSVEIGLPVLRCLTAMLSQHKLLSSKGTVLSLVCVTLLPLSLGGYADFLCVVRAVCDAVHAVLVHHPHTAHALMHLCFPVVSSVMKECIRRGDQKRLLANPDYIQPMTTCAEQVNRLVTLMVSGGEVGRVVGTMVSDYTTTVQSLTLLPAVKKWLVSSMYACLDVCDKHAIKQLRQRLPPGVRDVLHMLHNDYVTYHKYTGKV